VWPRIKPPTTNSYDVVKHTFAQEPDRRPPRSVLAALALFRISATSPRAMRYINGVLFPQVPTKGVKKKAGTP